MELRRPKRAPDAFAKAVDAGRKMVRLVMLGKMLCSVHLQRIIKPRDLGN